MIGTYLWLFWKSKKPTSTPKIWPREYYRVLGIIILYNSEKSSLIKWFLWPTICGKLLFHAFILYMERNSVKNRKEICRVMLIERRKIDDHLIYGYSGNHFKYKYLSDLQKHYLTMYSTPVLRTDILLCTYYVTRGLILLTNDFTMTMVLWRNIHVEATCASFIHWHP